MNLYERRVYAADWFMRAAAMPCSLILAAVVVNDPPDSVARFLLYLLVIVVGPAVIAGAWGAGLGASILDSAVTGSAGQATRRGLAVAGASFLTYLFVVSFVVTVFVFNDGGDVLKLFLFLLVYGTILVGWLMAAAGAFAGALLYKRQENQN